jgi:hypothetical protein
MFGDDVCRCSFSLPSVQCDSQTPANSGQSKKEDKPICFLMYSYFLEVVYVLLYIFYTSICFPQYISEMRHSFECVKKKNCTAVGCSVSFCFVF